LLAVAVVRAGLQVAVAQVVTGVLSVERVLVVGHLPRAHCFSVRVRIRSRLDRVALPEQMQCLVRRATAATAFSIRSLLSEEVKEVVSSTQEVLQLLHRQAGQEEAVRITRHLRLMVLLGLRAKVLQAEILPVQPNQISQLVVVVVQVVLV
jgi:hypothetical protein